MRSLGQGVAVVEQIPSKISPDVIKNSNTKIVHRLVSKDDQSLLAGSLSITDEDALYLNRLKTGHALCHKEGMERPVECIISNDVKTYAISDDKVHREMSKRGYKPLHSFETYELSSNLGNDGKEVVIRFFNSLCIVSDDRLQDLINSACNTINKLTLLKNNPGKFNSEVLADYFIKHIYELLSKGVYYKNAMLPRNLSQLLVGIIANSEISKLKEFKKCLGEYWQVNEPSTFISDVIENLALKLLITNKIGKTSEIIKKSISSFLLIENESFVEDLAIRITNMSGM